MRTRLLLQRILLLVMLAAMSACQQYFAPWGTGTVIDTLAGYKLGTEQSAVDLTKFILPVQQSFKNPDADVTINGQTFRTTLTLSFAQGELTEVRIVTENISSEELKKLESAAFEEIRTAYSKSLVKFKSDSYDLTLEDGAGHTLKLLTKEATLADNDAVFDYAISTTQMAQ